MKLELIEEQERLIVRPEGQMDAELGNHFASAVEQQLDLGSESLTIDLNELDFISLGGIRAILRLARYLKSVQTSLDFANGNNTVREALHQAGLDHLFPFTPPFHSYRGNTP